MSDRTAFQQAVTATKVSCIIGAVVTGSFLLLELYALFENRNQLGSSIFSKAGKRWRLSLASATFFAFILFQLDGALVWYDWTGQDQSCSRITIPHVLSFCLAKQCLYLFLYDRAKIVHESLKLNERGQWYLSLLRWGLWLTVVVGVPVFFYWSAFLAFNSRVASDPGFKTCIYYAIYPEVIVSFAVSDFFLASGMFLIFAFPLWAHVKEMTAVQSGRVETSKKLKNVIRTNLIYSSLALISAFVSLNVLAGFMWVARADGTPATDHYREWGLFAISLDNWIGIVLAHLMTSAWMPGFLRTWLRKPASTVDDALNTGKSPNYKSTMTGGKEKESTSVAPVVAPSGDDSTAA